MFVIIYFMENCKFLSNCFILVYLLQKTLAKLGNNLCLFKITIMGKVYGFLEEYSPLEIGYEGRG